MMLWLEWAPRFFYEVYLIEGQGNFGSIDGDPPAMRYTEVRMQRLQMKFYRS